MTDRKAVFFTNTPILYGNNKNSIKWMVPERCEFKFRYVILKLTLMIDSWNIMPSYKCHLTRLGSLQWRHNERDGVTKHQPHYCLLIRLFKGRPKKISKLRVTCICEGNYAENVYILWRHHDK